MPAFLESAAARPQDMTYPMNSTGSSRRRRRRAASAASDGESSTRRARLSAGSAAAVSAAGLAAAAAAASVAASVSVSTGVHVCDAFVNTPPSNAARDRPGILGRVPSPLFAEPSPDVHRMQKAAAAPRRYVRIDAKGTESSSPSRKRRYDVQTAVTTFAKIDPATGKRAASVDLHAQLHYGTPAYYAYYNDPVGFNAKYDRMHYELVVGQDMVESQSSDGTIRCIRPSPGGLSPIQASPSDNSLAIGYDLKCQADMINYAQKDWIHADLTREEFVAEAQKEQQQQQKARRDNTSEEVHVGDSSAQQPLWALASSSAVYPGSEFVSALLRPSTPSTGASSSVAVARRLFSNLFLPGDALAGLIRAFLWMLSPAPEVSVLLLDWSSLSPRPTGGISPIALPVMECLLSGNVREARKLVFGQMVVSGSGGQSADTDTNAILINKRNDKAIHVLQTSIQRDGYKSNALLYGASHCLDLQRRLQADGFVPIKTEWRTAWTVDVPPFGLGGGKVGKDMLPAFVSELTSPSSSNGIAVALVVLPLYFAIGGFDWLATIAEVGGALDKGDVGDGMLEVALYLVRHVALYLGLAKFVIDWDGQNTLFGAAGDDAR